MSETTRPAQDDPLIPFHGGVAIVTGAANGLGAELARQAALADMRVVLADIHEADLKLRSEEIRQSGGECLAIPTDVTDQASVEALAQITQETYGAVRLLINNAGVETLGRTWDIPALTWGNTISVNMLGPVHAVRAFMPGLIAAGQRAFIANVCSIGSLISSPIQSAYISSKHGLLGFTECLDLDIRDEGLPISVCAVLPGPVKTGIFDVASKTEGDSVEAHKRQMSMMLEQTGMPVKEAAAAILAGIASGAFWVSSHPDQLRWAAQRRGAMLSELIRPEAPSV